MLIYLQVVYLNKREARKVLGKFGVAGWYYRALNDNGMPFGDHVGPFLSGRFAYDHARTYSWARDEIGRAKVDAHANRVIDCYLGIDLDK